MSDENKDLSPIAKDGLLMYRETSKKLEAFTKRFNEHNRAMQAAAMRMRQDDVGMIAKYASPSFLVASPQ